MKTIIDIVLEKQIETEKDIEKLKKVLNKIINMFAIAIILNSVGILILNFWR